MKNKIFYTAAALRDLDEIWEHIGIGLNSPKAASRIVDQIMDDIDLLQDFSVMGRELSEITGIESAYRFLISGKYLVFYRPDNNEISIDRILHSRRDFLQILFE